MATTVVVQQRQRLYREGLGQLLAAEDDIDVVGTAGTGDDLLELCQAHRPTVAVLEADALEWDTTRLTRSLRRTSPAVRVIGLTTGEISSADAARAHRCGIRHVMPRSAGISQILLAVRSMAPGARGRPAYLPAPSSGPGDPPDPVLTSRELTVLNLVGAGFTSREIAAQLTISHKTVENHKQRIFGKLGVQNQAHAVSVAMRRGLMRPERVIGLSVAD